MPRTTENVEITESTLRVDSTVGAGEGLVMEDIEGSVLFTLYGKVAVGSEADAAPIASTALERDTWKYDIVEWTERIVRKADGLDAQEAATEAYEIISLQDAHHREDAEISDIENRRRRLETDSGQQSERVARASAYFERAIEEHGVDAIDADPDLKARILEEAAAVDTASLEEITRITAELDAEIEERKTKLEESLGAQLAEFQVSGKPAIKKLINPIRTLVRLGLLTSGDSFDGLLTAGMSFSSYGPNGQKLSINIPSNLNRLTLPLSYADALVFAERAYSEASTKKSIWAK